MNLPLIINSQTSNACQDKSPYRTKINSLTGDLLKVRSDIEPGKRVARESFYDGCWKLSRSVAIHHLGMWGWRESVYHDAEDVASMVCLNLLRQEEQNEGCFAPLTPTDSAKVLSVSVWEGCRQRIKDLWEKQRPDLVEGEGMALAYQNFTDKETEEAWKTLDRKETIECLRKKEIRRYGLEAGKTPLASVLNESLADAAMAGKSLRTWQRMLAESREQLAESLGYKPKSPQTLRKGRSAVEPLPEEEPRF